MAHGVLLRCGLIMKMYTINTVLSNPVTKNKRTTQKMPVLWKWCDNFIAGFYDWAPFENSAQLRKCFKHYAYETWCFCIIYCLQTACSSTASLKLLLPATPYPYDTSHQVQAMITLSWNHFSLPLKPPLGTMYTASRQQQWRQSCHLRV